MDFEKFSKKTAEAVDKELKILLKKWKSDVLKIDKSLVSLADQFIQANKGGKRIRGVLVVLGYELSKLTTDYRQPTTAEGGRPKTEDILKIAASYEIFHTAILAHDDVIDKSPIRRGQPSLYIALGGNHYGISQAICLGDAGFFLAQQVISESNFPDKEKLEALKWFNQTILDTAIGQMMDIKEGDSIIVARYKTAKYTVSGPLVLGATLAGVSQGLIRVLEEFGENLGIAFQIQDDILDSEVDWLGGMDSAKKTAEQYKNKALKILPSISKDKNMSKLLLQMADYLVQRTK
ncbi:polyprenyl synthetase family protein [Candidatus Daviesbacteria bacterium]|nr:polyprenyl synthetase family protein [Candidatus Daviesbacteria bacterium]